jgi:hypothetical protein
MLPSLLVVQYAVSPSNPSRLRDQSMPPSMLYATTIGLTAAPSNAVPAAYTLSLETVTPHPAETSAPSNSEYHLTPSPDAALTAIGEASRLQMTVITVANTSTLFTLRGIFNHCFHLYFFKYLFLSNVIKFKNL